MSRRFTADVSIVEDETIVESIDAVEGKIITEDVAPCDTIRFTFRIPGTEKEVWMDLDFENLGRMVAETLMIDRER